MSLIKLSDIRFRIDPGDPPAEINPELFLPHYISKISVCELEGDASAEHILNRLEIKEGELGSNPGIVSLWEDERQRRRNKNVSSQISQGSSQTRRECAATASHVMLKQALRQRLVALSKNPERSGDSDTNVSVYPAETPESEDVMNASYVDHHASQSSFNSSSMDDATLKNETTLNESWFEGGNLIDLLCHVAEKEEVEEGSILSQIVEDPEGSDGVEEADLSLPLIQSPVKEINIPQLDGSTEEFVSKYDRNKAGNRDCEYIPKRDLDMPELGDVDYKKEFFIPTGKFFILELKRRILSQTKNEILSVSHKPQKSPPRRFKRKIKRIGLLELIKLIQGECTLKRIEKGKKPKFSVVPASTHFETLPLEYTQTARVSFPTLDDSYDYDILIPCNHKLFSSDEIMNSQTFLSLRESTPTKSRKRKKQDPLVGLNLSEFGVCCRRAKCSVLKRKLRELIRDLPQVNPDEIKVLLKDFTCIIPSSNSVGPEVRKRRSTVKDYSEPKRGKIATENGRGFAEESISELTAEVSHEETLESGGGSLHEEVENSLTHHTNTTVIDHSSPITTESSSSSEQVNIAGNVDPQKESYLTKRRYMRIYKKVAKRQLRGLDGPNDSSSSSDEEYEISSSRKKSFYNPLFTDSPQNFG